MEKYIKQFNDISIIDYKFDKTTVRYINNQKTNRIFMYLLPNSICGADTCVFETVREIDNFFPNHKDWIDGSLVHFHVRGDGIPTFANSLKFSESVLKLNFKEQSVREENGDTEIKTYLISSDGYEICHTLRHIRDINAFEVYCTFNNTSKRAITLEMISSASIDNLSPFNNASNVESLVWHTFKSGWSIEGKHIEEELHEIGMDKSWGGSYESISVGTIGSKATRHYFPYVALEDTRLGCIWGMKLKHNATWKAELTRYGTPLSVSIGIGDRFFGDWYKTIAVGESIVTPTAYIASVNGDIADLSDELLKLNERDASEYGEEDMPIAYNDWGLHWGNTSEEKMLSLAKKVRQTNAKYFIVDDGWQTGGVGDWEIDYEKFPNGLKTYADNIREMGMIPGIWMEFEVVRLGAKRFAEENDHLCLKLHGKTLNEVNCSLGKAKFLDFRQKDVIVYLREKVIKFLKDNNFGYMKVDYNSNISVGCDDKDSLGEGLRVHMDEVYKFFKTLKQEMPELIVECCSTGGQRLDGKFMGITAMSSVTDALESIDVPVIAANMHYLVPPCQAQIWCVIKSDYSEKRIDYSIASGFLGRICWTGDFDCLSNEQFDKVLKAERLYEDIKHIIKDGKSKIFRTDKFSLRNPKGTQAVVRYSDDMKEALIVVHCFNSSREMKIELPGNFKIEESLTENEYKIHDNELFLTGKDISADVLYLKAL